MRWAALLADLRAGELVAGEPSAIALTSAGEALARGCARLPVGRELAEVWASKLKGSRARVVRFMALPVAGGPPEAAGVVGRNQLAEAIGVRPTSGGYAQTLADLSKLGILEGAPSRLVLHRALIRKGP